MATSGCSCLGRRTPRPRPCARPAQAFAGGCVDLYGYGTPPQWQGAYAETQDLTNLAAITQFRADYKVGPDHADVDQLVAVRRQVPPRGYRRGPAQPDPRDLWREVGHLHPGVPGRAERARFQLGRRDLLPARKPEAESAAVAVLRRRPGRRFRHSAGARRLRRHRPDRLRPQRADDGHRGRVRPGRLHLAALHPDARRALHLGAQDLRLYARHHVPAGRRGQLRPADGHHHAAAGGPVGLQLHLPGRAEVPDHRPDAGLRKRRHRLQERRLQRQLPQQRPEPGAVAVEAGKARRRHGLRGGREGHAVRPAPRAERRAVLQRLPQ